jgi:hypothetical protein
MQLDSAYACFYTARPNSYSSHKAALNKSQRHNRAMLTPRKWTHKRSPDDYPIKLTR